MSHPDHDPTIHWINEATASMGGNALEHTEQDQIVEPVAMIETIPGAISDEDQAEGYRGLADELLLAAGHATIHPKVRDALADYIGAGIVSALLRDNGRGDPVSDVLIEVGISLREGMLLTDLEEEAKFIEARQEARLSPLARWRQNRRRAAEEAKTAKQHYQDRQDALRRLKHRTFDDGSLRMNEGMQEGDNVELYLQGGKDAAAVSTRIRGKVVGHVEDEALLWDAGRAIKGVVLEITGEERANPENFIHTPIPKGARVVVYGTAVPSTNVIRGDHTGKIVRGLTPVIGWEGEALKLVSHGRSSRTTPRLIVEQLTINEVDMFDDSTERIRYK